VRAELDPTRQLVVYDAHNVEGLLRTRLLDDGGVGTRVARGVVRQEHELCHAADLVLACSHEDRLLFERLHGVPAGKLRVVPNGVFADRVRPATAAERQEARRSLGAPEGTIALFLGSAYTPNVEAARVIAEDLAPAFPDLTFVIAGGVGGSLAVDASRRPSNLRVTGQLGEEDKLRWLAAADLALNPMLSGSGTNIKMFDFMAAGLPVLTTPVGARGIDAGAELLFEVREPPALAAGLRDLLQDAERRQRLARNARAQALRRFAWERIAPTLGLLLRRHLRTKRGAERPFFTVVVPSYERHAQLSRLADCLAAQSERDFEVIVVDQSAGAWPDRGRGAGLDLEYVRTDVRGAVHARNLGGFLARGEVIAFTDDDCEPSPDWLRAARPLFADSSVVGVEGLIRCDAVADPSWRVVTNEGWVGLGFMTANLFLRTSAFQHLDGFDLAFDDPHFREDTDLGWRALELGRIPFSEKAWVHHPPQPRGVERESAATRDRFFVKDALLYRKHPERFVDLIRREGHLGSNENYLRYLLEGLRRYGVRPGADLLALVPPEKRPLFLETG
jgi:glycosyltransferase involved in cell wall biosynthesis